MYPFAWLVLPLRTDLTLPVLLPVALAASFIVENSAINSPSIVNCRTAFATGLFAPFLPYIPFFVPL